MAQPPESITWTEHATINTSKATLILLPKMINSVLESLSLRKFSAIQRLNSAIHASIRFIASVLLLGLNDTIVCDQHTDVY